MKLLFILLLGVFTHGWCVDNGNPTETCQTTDNQGNQKDDSSRDPGDVKIYEHTLKNGLRIVVVPVESNGRIYFGVLYGVGSVDDPMGKVGLSHFLEHMMFKGTKSVSKDHLHYLLSKYCVSFGANTDCDYTLYHHIVRKEFLYLSLVIEADRMVNLRIDDTEFAIEKGVILEEAGLRNIDPTSRYLNDAGARMWYLYSQYAPPVIGTTYTIENISPKALRKHYKKYYVPNNATLIFVGNIQIEEVVPIAEKYFGRLKPSKELKRRVIPEPLNTGIRYFIEKSVPEIKTQTLQISYSFDKNIVVALKDMNIARFMTFMLFGPYGLTKVMKDEKNLICSARIDLGFNRGNKAFLYITLSLRDGVDRRVVEKECLEIVRNFKKFLTNDLLQKEKEKDSTGFKFMTDSPQELFGEMVGLMKGECSLDDANNRPKIIDDITLDDLINMAAKIFRDENMNHMVYSHPTTIRCFEY
jgi:zinc protease